MRVAISGSHGLIGSALIEALEAEGDEVTRLARGVADPAVLEGHDAVVHLAGAGIGDHRWTDSYKRLVLESRVKGTTALAKALAGLERKPGVLVSGSAVGYYGDRGEEALTEASAPGTGFLSDVVQQWEAAAAPAADAGIRVVNIRSGIVMTGRGGALKKQLLPFKLGLGGRLGSGKQYLSWVALEDEIGGIRHALSNESVRGPINLTAPNPVTNREFTKTLGRVLRRPTLIPVPTPALDLILGRQLVREMLLGGQRVLPAVLQAHRYEFRYPQLEDALRSATA
ncbi:MAG TPA: TIGR01777 family oxidoreductase [Acidimicrobiales bacterium]|nr:TIGR01777 family oxidoreductase [Acidimicrobiales bacterium]